MLLRSMLLIASVGLVSTAQAADMYRWVDEKGRTHVSDTVPERYKRKARRIDSTQFNATDAQKAQAAAVRDRLKAAASAPVPVPAAAPTASGASSPGTGPAGIGRPASAPGAAPADCAALLQRYRASQECFAPYRMANGALRVEAFERCQNVPDPTPQCGPPNWD